MAVPDYVVFLAGDFTANVGLNSLAAVLGVLGIAAAAVYRGLTIAR